MTSPTRNPPWWRDPGTVDLTDPAGARGRCLIESHPLAVERGALLIRVTGRTYNREHWAVYLPDDPTEPDAGGQVLDPTARQFWPHTQPAPWTGAMEDWLDDACEWLRDGLQFELHRPTPGYQSEVVGGFDVWVRDDIEPGPMPG